MTEYTVPVTFLEQVGFGSDNPDTSLIFIDRNGFSTRKGIDYRFTFSPNTQKEQDGSELRASVDFGIYSDMKEGEEYGNTRHWSMIISNKSENLYNNARTVSLFLEGTRKLPEGETEQTWQWKPGTYKDKENFYERKFMSKFWAFHVPMTDYIDYEELKKRPDMPEDLTPQPFLGSEMNMQAIGPDDYDGRDEEEESGYPSYSQVMNNSPVKYYHQDVVGRGMRGFFNLACGGPGEAITGGKPGDPGFKPEKAGEIGFGVHVFNRKLSPLGQTNEHNSRLGYGGVNTAFSCDDYRARAAGNPYVINYGFVSHIGGHAGFLADGDSTDGFRASGKLENAAFAAVGEAKIGFDAQDGVFGDAAAWFGYMNQGNRFIQFGSDEKNAGWGAQVGFDSSDRRFKINDANGSDAVSFKLVGSNPGMFLYSKRVLNARQDEVERSNGTEHDNTRAINEIIDRLESHGLIEKS